MNIISFLKKITSFRKPKLIVVLGATSTGKSDIAVEIAKKFNGEVVSADSRQVYKNLDLGSGKITKEEMQSISHFMLDVANPKDIFTVSDFKGQANEAIKDILSRGKIPILCGGTGFYIQAITDNLDFPSVPPNEKLRAKLEKLSIEELVKKLGESDKKRLKNMDLNNKRHLIRAIEIAETLGKVPKLKISHPYNTLFLGLKLEDSLLRERIHKRILVRIEQGMIEEVRKLMKGGISEERLHQLGLEYRYISQYILGELEYDKMIEILFHKICQFAKRQKTWFKRNKKTKWFDPILEQEKIFEEVKLFLS